MILRYKRICYIKSLFINQAALISIPRHLSGINCWNDDISTSIKHKIEDYWSKKLFQLNEDDSTGKPKYYVLSMFPYPSGHLHMGHVRVYTISDCVARFQRMNGFNVIHPIGWDAFGLPAENAAIERNVPPEAWTKQNISHMKNQLQQLGISFDWNREITTCDPNYYKWTQYLFLQLFKAGFAYQKNALVNWDPVDKTVLADEQVDEHGNSWRSGAKVEKKLLKQWFIRTTRFAQQLLDGLSDPDLQDWRDVINLQQHWIGECNGVSFDFKLENSHAGSITLWTAIPEHLALSRFIVISSKHVLANEHLHEDPSGLKRLQAEAINPINGNKLPIFITDKLEFESGTDCHIGIPAVVSEDKEFAKYLNIQVEEDVGIISEEKKLALQKENCLKAQKLNQGGYWTSAKLRDWLISRQRYWGTPIPVIHCKTCGVQPVPECELPVELPKLDNISQKGGQFLVECSTWLNTSCPECGKPAFRETDTMDTFVDSSWYFLRYVDPHSKQEPFSEEKAKELMPVDLYIGGKEHAVLHLYYARFFNHFLHYLGLVANREPFKRLLVQGMVMGRSFRIKGTGQYLPENQVNIINLKKNKAESKDTKQPVTMAWEKMSKSKYNGVDPAVMFESYGVDTTRLLILADVAPTSHRNWNANTFPGILNWQRRLWITIQDFIKHRSDPELKVLDEEKAKQQEDYMFDSRNYYIKGTTFNYCQSQQISVAVSKMQGLTNSLRRASATTIAHSLQFERALAALIIMLAPMAPHFASELWSGFQAASNRLCSYEKEINWGKSVLEQNWPQIDWNYKLDLVCKVNGFEHSILKIPRKEIEKLNKDEAVKIALVQKDLHMLLQKFSVKEVMYEMHPGYAGIVHFITTATWKELNKEIGTEKV